MSTNKSVFRDPELAEVYETIWLNEKHVAAYLAAVVPYQGSQVKYKYKTPGFLDIANDIELPDIVNRILFKKDLISRGADASDNKKLNTDIDWFLIPEFCCYAHAHAFMIIREDRLPTLYYRYAVVDEREAYAMFINDPVNEEFLMTRKQQLQRT